MTMVPRWCDRSRRSPAAHQPAGRRAAEACRRPAQPRRARSHARHCCMGSRVLPDNDRTPPVRRPSERGRGEPRRTGRTGAPVQAARRPPAGRDEVLIAMAHQAGPRACLSTYPPDVTMMGQDPGVLTLCESYWNERGLLVFRASVPLPPRAAPRPIGFAAAGFMFCPATILADVPFGAPRRGCLPSTPTLIIPYHALSDAPSAPPRRWAVPNAWDPRAASALPARPVSASAA